MHPILLTIKQFKLFGITIGPLHIFSYGTMLVLGFVAGLIAAIYRAPGKNIKKDDIFDLGLLTLILGIIGGRISYVLTHLGYYSKNSLEILNLSAGGLAWHGALLGAICAMAIFCKIKKINMGTLFDCLAPAFPIGQAIGRIGCFLNGCCGGIQATGVCLGYISKVKIFNLRHPAQLYELILDLCIFAFLLIYEKKTRFKGELFLAYLASYSFVRFFVEYLRDHPQESTRFMGGLFSLGQMISLITFAVVLLWIIIGRREIVQKGVCAPPGSGLTHPPAGGKA